MMKPKAEQRAEGGAPEDEPRLWLVLCVQPRRLRARDVWVYEYVAMAPSADEAKRLVLAEHLEDGAVEIRVKPWRGRTAGVGSVRLKHLLLEDKLALG